MTVHSLRERESERDEGASFLNCLNTFISSLVLSRLITAMTPLNRVSKRS